MTSEVKMPVVAWMYRDLAEDNWDLTFICPVGIVEVHEPLVRQSDALAAIEAARVEARVKALEEAAKACEQMHDEDRPGDYAWTVRSLAKEAP